MADGGAARATLPALSGGEEGRKRVEKVGVRTRNPDTLRHVEKKLVDKGMQRLDRHPVDGKGGIGRPPPKEGRGGRYTWEGPDGPVEDELEAAPPAVDERDPNYVDEEAEEKIVKGEDEAAAGVVVGEVEVAKAAEAKEGVARVEIDPQLNV